MDAPISDPLARTLDDVAVATAGLRDPWWLIGSAAGILAGAAVEVRRDVDILASERDAHALLALPGSRVKPTGGLAQFRSVVYGLVGESPLDVEVMAGFEVLVDGAWRPLAPRSRVAVPWNGGTLFIPDAAEQAAICRLFGRPKDLARAVLLDALG